MKTYLVILTIFLFQITANAENCQDQLTKEQADFAVSLISPQKVLKISVESLNYVVPIKTNNNGRLLIESRSTQDAYYGVFINSAVLFPGNSERPLNLNAAYLEMNGELKNVADLIGCSTQGLLDR